MDEKYDTALLGILQHEGKIEKFLDVILGFLYRRTDFYRIMKSKDDRMGFPPGVALQMLASTYKKYDELAVEAEKAREQLRERMEQMKAEQQSESGKKEKHEQESETPNSNEECLYTTETVNVNEDVKIDRVTTITGAGDSQSDKADSGKTDVVKENNTENVMETEEVETEVPDSEVVEGTNETEAKDEPKTNTESKKAVDPRTGEEDDDPELTKQQKLFQDDPESYNGARRDHFRWAQSITDLDLRVNVPAQIKKGRDCRVNIDKKHVKVEFKDASGGWTVAVNGDLTWEVHKDESVWSLVPGDHIHINFEKKEERWWEAFFTDEPKISVRKIDASRPMSDLDDEAQAKIEEMMYNDRRKKMGLPQTHEEKMQHMLRRAWDAEGSPFKGQPFDPSKCSVDPSGIMHFKP